MTGHDTRTKALARTRRQATSVAKATVPTAQRSGESRTDRSPDTRHESPPGATRTSRGAPTPSPAGVQSDLVAGLLAHFATLLQTGCPKSARLAVLLLDRIGRDRQLDTELRRHGDALREVLDERLADLAPAPCSTARRHASMLTFRPGIPRPPVGATAGTDVGSC